MARLKAIVIEPDTQARVRLREATIAMPEFAGVVLQSNIDAVTHQLGLASQQPIDIIFLSYRIPHEEIRQFIVVAKSLPASQDTAFVLLLRDQDRNGGAVATNLLIGADGFLFEPYSVEGLRETVMLASKVRKERSDQRQIAAVTVLLDDLARSINTLAAVQYGNSGSTRMMQQVKERASVLQNLSDEVRQVYYDMTIKVFESVPAPSLKMRPYKGTSSRVKKKIADKLAGEIEAAEAQTGASAVEKPGA